MDSPTMKMPSTVRPALPRASQLGRRALQASLVVIVAISAGNASAQIGRNAQEAHSQWRRLTQAEINCVDQALRSRNSSLWSLIQRGVGPSDPSAAELRAGCRANAAARSSTTVTTVTYQTSQTSHAQTSQRESSAEAPRQYWNLNGSTLNLVADGDLRRFYYYEIQPEAPPTGARKGALLIEGKMLGTHFLGTAYKFSSNCGRVPYRVDGMFRDNNRRLELQGQSPRVDAYCVMQGTEMASLTLKAVDSSVAVAKESAKPGDAAASKTAVRRPASGNMQDDKNDSVAKDQPATGKAKGETAAAATPAVDKTAAGKPAAEKAPAAEPAAEKVANEKDAVEKVATAEAAASADVVQVAPADKTGAAKTTTDEGAAEVTIPLNRNAERSAPPPPAMDGAAADGERANTDGASTEHAETEPSKAGANREAASRETTGIATLLSVDLDSETRLSFVCGLLSGMAIAGALAFVFLARLRKRYVKAAAVAAAQNECANRGSQCQFDLLVRAVLAEQNRLHLPAGEPHGAERV